MEGSDSKGEEGDGRRLTKKKCREVRGRQERIRVKFKSESYRAKEQAR